MNQLSAEKRCQVVAALVEGNSLRSTCRMTGIAMNTLLKLLKDLGTVAAEYHDIRVRKLACKNIQADEVWAFCYAKAKNMPPAVRGRFGFGDVWTYAAIDSDSKLIASWYVGLRDAESAYAFMVDLASRLDDRVQLSTDRFSAYLKAVEAAFGDKIDYGQISKLYGRSPAYEGAAPERRFSPSDVVSVRKYEITGKPDPESISTSHVERQNLTIRMGMRRFTRLTNGFSKKIENHIYATAIHFLHYDFCRVHMTLKTTPAVAAGLAERPWTIAELVGLLTVKDSN